MQVGNAAPARTGEKTHTRQILRATDGPWSTRPRSAHRQPQGQSTQACLGRIVRVINGNGDLSEPFFAGNQIR